jgi:hypothetical protein
VGQNLNPELIKPFTVVHEQTGDQTTSHNGSGQIRQASKEEYRCSEPLRLIKPCQSDFGVAIESHNA